ncbi:MAG: phosphatase PAP2 family protein [Methylobacteriaceae bacterium]|nr:phosphatase PAP2 family protein [Methylobacteriaceae bacterium]
MALMPRQASDPRCLAYTVAFLFCLFVTAVVALHPDWFDRPLAERIRSVARDHHFASVLALYISNSALEGAVVVSLLWHCWFSRAEEELRSRMVSGIFAAVLAGLVAHLLQHALPSPPKPIFDPMLELSPPAVPGDTEDLAAAGPSNGHTFPSERATMFAGLAILIFLIRPRLGSVALACTAVVETSRIYVGFHYPGDIVGSLFLASTTLWPTQMRWGWRLGQRVVTWERSHKATFYMLAFLACYQMVTAFQDLRDLVAQVLRGTP